MRAAEFATRLEDSIAGHLRRCTTIPALKKAHARVLVSFLSQSSYTVTRMVDVCDVTGDAVYAGMLFRQISRPNIYLYNAIIRICTHGGMYAEAVAYYKCLLEKRRRDDDHRLSLSPDRFTFPFVIKSCTELPCCGGLGLQVHGHVCKFGVASNKETADSLMAMYGKFHDSVSAQRLFDGMTRRNSVSWNALIYGYARAGETRKAQAAFDESPEKTIVTWTVLIAGYAESGRYDNAVSVFRRMRLDGVEPDCISIVAVLPACAELGDLALGESIHFFAEKRGYLSSSTPLCNALIDLYAKCGRDDRALEVFEGTPEKDVISWSSAIGALARHGKGEEAIEIFNRMADAGVRPNRVTFLGLLSACAHTGLVDRGLRYFISMKEEHGIDPEIQHYGCVVDLLGRSGCLRQALNTIREMPMEADAAIWGSLLSSCERCGNPEIASIAFAKLVKLEPRDGNRNVVKIPGCSWIDLKNSE